MQASASQDSFSLSSVLQADVFEQYGLREKLEAVPGSVLRSYSRSQEVNASSEGLSSSSDLASNEPSLDRSSSLHQSASLKYPQEVQEKDWTELTNFDDIVPSKPPLSCLKPSASCNGPILSYCPSLPLLALSRWNRDGHEILHCLPFLKPFNISAGHRSRLYLQEKPYLSSLPASHLFVLWKVA